MNANKEDLKMNLNELRETKKTKLAIKVLRESYGVNLNVNKLDIRQTKNMLSKVRGLINETKQSTRIHSSHKSPDYLKLLMMEQALSGHLSHLRTQTRIMVENEEVQKSQVILAAQDMVDSIQKMLEQISKMNVEELPAVVDGISNEIGSNESEQFAQSAGNALNTLQQGLSTAKQELTSALATVTGQGGGMPAGGAEGMPGEELGGDMGMAAGAAPGGELPEMPGGGGEELPELPELPEEPEERQPGNTGRGRR
jgi:hypothetical protein